MVIMFVYYYVYLVKQKDARVANVKLLLLTATKEGPVVDAIERLFEWAGMTRGTVCLAREPGRSQYRVWDVFGDGCAAKPKEWGRAVMPEKACMAAEAMVCHHRARGNSAQILFILPGETEIHDVRNALRTHGFQSTPDIFLCFSSVSCTARQRIRFRGRSEGAEGDGWRTHYFAAW